MVAQIIHVKQQRALQIAPLRGRQFFIEGERMRQFGDTASQILISVQNDFSFAFCSIFRRFGADNSGN